jgi:hypothetical protein
MLKEVLKVLQFIIHNYKITYTYFLLTRIEKQYQKCVLDDLIKVPKPKLISQHVNIYYSFIQSERNAYLTKLLSSKECIFDQTSFQECMVLIQIYLESMYFLFI